MTLGVDPIYFEELAEGFEFGGSAITITETHVVTYAGIVGDFYALHMDAEAAKGSRFGRRVAHGPFTLALTMGQLAQRITHMNWQVQAAIGVTDVRFPEPVFLGDTITPRGRIGAAKAREANGLLSIAMGAVNQRGDEVLNGTFTLMVARGVVNTAASAARA